jgi:hypothetical protein
VSDRSDSELTARSAVMLSQKNHFLRINVAETTTKTTPQIFNRYTSL